HLVGPPVLGEFHRGASEVAGILLQLGLEACKQRERICRRPREPCQYLIVIELANLLRSALHHRRADRHLPIGGHHDRVPTPHTDHRSRPNPPPLPQIQRVPRRNTIHPTVGGIGRGHRREFKRGRRKGRIHEQFSENRSSTFPPLRQP